MSKKTSADNSFSLFADNSNYMLLHRLKRKPTTMARIEYKKRVNKRVKAQRELSILPYTHRDIIL